MAASFLPDTPAQTDSFSRSPFAEKLARSLCLPADAPGIVIAIEGEWGSGKSTLIEFIKKTLLSNNPPILVDFNPWIVSGSEAIIESLLGAIASAVGHDSGTDTAERGISTGKKILSYVERNHDSLLSVETSAHRDSQRQSSK